MERLKNKTTKPGQSIQSYLLSLNQQSARTPSCAATDALQHKKTKK